MIEDPIHRSDRAVVNALVEQGRIDLGRRLICETRRVQHVQHDLLLRLGQRAGRPRPWKRKNRRRGKNRASPMHRGPRNSDRGANGGGHAAGGRKIHDSLGQGSSPPGASGTPSRSESFFWTAMMASARARRRVRWALSFCNEATSAASGLGPATFRTTPGRRQRAKRSGVTLPAPVAQGRRIDPPRDGGSRRYRRFRPPDPVAARMRSLSRAVNVRRRGPADNSEGADGGAAMTVGLWPPFLAAPASALS